MSLPPLPLSPGIIPNTPTSNFSLKGHSGTQTVFPLSYERTPLLALPLPHAKYHVLPSEHIYETVSPIQEEYDPRTGYIGLERGRWGMGDMRGMRKKEGRQERAVVDDDEKVGKWTEDEGENEVEEIDVYTFLRSRSVRDFQPGEAEHSGLSRLGEEYEEEGYEGRESMSSHGSVDSVISDTDIQVLDESSREQGRVQIVVEGYGWEEDWERTAGYVVTWPESGERSSIAREKRGSEGVAEEVEDESRRRAKRVKESD
ncbi:hypothetical protein BCR34DRAFT_182955 [Clohesyomyces aquaticus]|uniref:Uncharacterized protein n=1 Tax=Clohesyomyces aquaticus TaxID=1231657 RepID=A0A1Y1ZYF1_9PLEO|nr:hypothetical protein BCR34DRAFT_182955 [Clohesyomyces aquaticus]